MPQAMKPSEINQLVDILAKEAAVFPDGAAAFLLYLINTANLPPAWISLWANIGRNSPPVEARRLINWAINQDVNPVDPGSTTLGSLLKALLPILGGGNATFIKGLIKDYNL